MKSGIQSLVRRDTPTRTFAIAAALGMGAAARADEASDIRVRQDLAAKVCSPCFCDSAPLVSLGPQAQSWAPLPEGPRRLSLGRLLSQGMVPSPSPVRRAIATGATIER